MSPTRLDIAPVTTAPIDVCCRLTQRFEALFCRRVRPRQDATYCTGYETAGCGPVVAPPCEGGVAARCIDGRCEAVFDEQAASCIADNPATPETSEQAPDSPRRGRGSAEAAACIAAEAGLAEGLAPWDVNLVCHFGYEAVVWNVTNLEYDDGPDGRGGSAFTIDAQSGGGLAELAWSAEP